MSADEAWETFKDQYFGESSDLAEGFKNDNPLAGSDNYEVYMTDVASQKKLVSFAESLDGVRKVNKSDTVANTLNSVNKLVWYVSVVIIAILLAVSIFLISNTVTMGITVRREEIAIMKYIGAKDGFVRAPFIIEGILIGLVGAAIPLGILYVLYNKAIKQLLCFLREENSNRLCRKRISKPSLLKLPGQIPKFRNAMHGILPILILSEKNLSLKAILSDFSAIFF